MSDKNLIVSLGIFIFFLNSFATVKTDQPCAAREIYNRAVICVCNTTYCDTMTRESLSTGTYVVYTSSESGLRFQKSSSLINVFGTLSEYSTTIELDSTIRYQTIYGFGGSVSDSAGYTWDSLQDENLKQFLIDSYFSENGLEYNMIRTPIGGSDFSTHAYTLNDYPIDDRTLSNFSLSYEDYAYKLPMIKAAMAAAKAPIYLMASMWSPPAWMKTSNNLTGIGYLKDDYYDVLAEYHRRFIEEYKKHNVSTWAVTTTNEPLNGVVNLVDFNCLGWSIEGMGTWIVDYLVPTIKKYDSTIKVLGVDDQRNTLPIWTKFVAMKHPEFATALDGIALHFYTDDITPPSLVTEVMEKYPNLFVMATETSIVPRLIGDGSDPVEYGAWYRAEIYASSILESLNYNYTGWIDWNLCLNTEGGPRWSSGNVDSPIIINATEGAFYKQPMFYALSHFSKFIPRDSVRIKSTESDTCSNTLKFSAFLTPQNTIAVVMLNEEVNERVVRLKFGDNEAKIILQAKSIATVEFNNE